MIRKIRVDDPPDWEHHRGGWHSAVAALANRLHTPDGTRCLTAVEDVIASGQVLSEPWIGVIHQAPRTNALQFPDLYRLLHDPVWEASKPHCYGLYVLCQYLKEYLETWNVGVPVCVIPYPADVSVQPFSMIDFKSGIRRVIFVGEYLRDFEAFGQLQAPGYQQMLLKPSESEPDFETRYGLQSLQVLDRVTNEKYDELLARSIVFLRLHDGVAITTVIECIVRGTPVLVNRFEALEEYLGSDYPLFYETLGEATGMLKDEALLEEASNYLRHMSSRKRLTYDHLVQAVSNSAIYKSLPVPSSQLRNSFKTCDLSILICSHNRVEQLPSILEAFTQQEFSGTFEILIWNNNYERRTEVDEAVAPFKSGLQVQVIHSTENYYCMVRLAMPSIMRGPLLLICDDDVQPTEGYISRFHDKWLEYGPEAAICARGHLFLPHKLDEEDPERVWREQVHLEFYDEADEDRRVHFMHADNCLIPRQLLTEIINISPPALSTALVDDYWMSYVLGHHLEVPIWKVRSEDVLSFTQSSEDPAVALYHNPAVQEERIAFYIHHMREGWPKFWD